jgi:phenylacetate-coenzyme A ligase PaaK-like adenylate-forming protein
LRSARQAAAQEHLPRRQLEAFQQRRLERLVAHASGHAPWHQRRLAGLIDAGAAIELEGLPRMDKQEMMDHFDEAVSDSRLTLAAVTRHIAHLSRGELFAGEYRIASTSGTSGVKAYFCFSRSSWRANMAAYLRVPRALGINPRIPRWKIAQLTAGGPLHLTHRLATTVDIGAHCTIRLSVSDPISSLAAALDRFQPDAISGYPSVLAALADEQLAGRLDIGPAYCVVTAEQCTPNMRNLIERAWGIQPFNAYATTETGGALALECAAHNGMHIFEDRVLLEVVDTDRQPVPDGKQGERVLLTNLDNLAQPIIRYELDDMLTLDSAPCTCGRTTRRIVAIEGRAGDILRFEAPDGTSIPIHPSHLLEHVGEQPWVRQWQVTYRPGELDISIVADPGSKPNQATVIRDLEQRIRDAGAQPPHVRVLLVDDIPRSPSGKHMLVRNYSDAGDTSTARQGQ